MMTARRIFGTAAFAAAAFLSAQAFADNDIDLPINGDFRGTPAGYCPAPGWTLTAGGGSARILPTTDRDDFMLELRAQPGQSQSVTSDLHALSGYMLKLELKVHGTGSASAGYEAFDASRTMLVASDRQLVTLAGYDQKIKRYFQIPAQAKFVRIRLTAEAGSVALFRDVDADLSIIPAAPAGSIAAPPAAPAAAPVAAPVAAPAVAPAAAPAPAVSTTAVAHPPAKILQNDRYYAYTFLSADEHYEISLPVGSDIEFKLGENVNARQYWTMVSYDPAICRVKIEHDQDGVFPLRFDKAEIELKALSRGTTTVVLSSGEKKFTVYFTGM